MAGYTLAVSTASTTNTTSYTTGSFTPVAGDMLVVAVYAQGTNVAATATMSGSANGLTFDIADSILANGTSATLLLFVSDLVPSSPSAMTVTFDCSADAATGAIVTVGRVSGMSLSGLAAVLQTVGTNSNVTTGSPASLTFPSAPGSSNIVIAVLGNNTSNTGVTAPSGFTSASSNNFATPTTGMQVVYDAASAPTTVTWGSTSATVGGTIAIELDTSASSTPISASDTGSGSDAAAVDAALDASDSGAGADGAAVAVATAASDTGAGSDAASVAAGLTPADTGSGADSASVAAGLTASDTGAGADSASVAVAVTLTDTGTSVDAISVNTGGSAAVSPGDTGAGSDAASVAAAVPAGDTGAGADAASVSATILATETGAGANTASVAAGVTGSDSSSGANSASVAAAVTLGDTGAATEGFSIQVILSASDTGSAADVLSVQTSGSEPEPPDTANARVRIVWPQAIAEVHTYNVRASIDMPDPMYVGDLLPQLRIDVTVDGVDVDFSTASAVTVSVTLDGTLIVTDRAVTTKALGYVLMDWQADDTDTAGLLEFEVRATWSSKPRTFRPSTTVIIHERLA